MWNESAGVMVVVLSDLVVVEDVGKGFSLALHRCLPFYPRGSLQSRS